MSTTSIDPYFRRSGISNQIVRISGPRLNKVLSVKQERVDCGCLHGPKRTKTYSSLAKQVKFNKDLDPAILDYYPDFGFVDKLNGENLDKGYNMWRLLYDQVREYPKFERIRNLVYRLSMEKYKRVAKQVLEQNR